jgi:ATP-dependent Lon protease
MMGRYVGALPGLLVQGLRKVGVSNPLILCKPDCLKQDRADVLIIVDEIDKSAYRDQVTEVLLS